MTGVAEEVQQRFDHASKDYALQQTRTLLATRAKELRQEAQVHALLALLSTEVLALLALLAKDANSPRSAAKELRPEAQVLALLASLVVACSVAALLQICCSERASTRGPTSKRRELSSQRVRKSSDQRPKYLLYFTSTKVQILTPEALRTRTQFVSFQRRLCR